MTPEIIQTIAQFMNRATLSPPEIPAYQKCMQALGQEMQRLQMGPKVTPKEEEQLELDV